MTRVPVSATYLGRLDTVLTLAWSLLAKAGIRYCFLKPLIANLLFFMFDYSTPICCFSTFSRPIIAGVWILPLNANFWRTVPLTSACTRMDQRSNQKYGRNLLVLWIQLCVLQLFSLAKNAEAFRKHPVLCYWVLFPGFWYFSTVFSLAMMILKLSKILVVFRIIWF